MRHVSSIMKAVASGGGASTSSGAWSYGGGWAMVETLSYRRMPCCCFQEHWTLSFVDIRLSNVQVDCKVYTSIPGFSVLVAFGIGSWNHLWISLLISLLNPCFQRTHGLSPFLWLFSALPHSYWDMLQLLGHSATSPLRPLRTGRWWVHPRPLLTEGSPNQHPQTDPERQMPFHPSLHIHDHHHRHGKHHKFWFGCCCVSHPTALRQKTWIQAVAESLRPSCTRDYPVHLWWSSFCLQPTVQSYEPRHRLASPPELCPCWPTPRTVSHDEPGSSNAFHHSSGLFHKEPSQNVHTWSPVSIGPILLQGSVRPAWCRQWFEHSTS